MNVYILFGINSVLGFITHMKQDPYREEENLPFTETEGSASCSQVHAFGPYPEHDGFSSQSGSMFL
jgi:hypothetical protein